LSNNTETAIVLIPTEKGPISKLKTETAAGRRITAGGFSPDGRYLVYSSLNASGSGGISILTTDGRSDVTIVQGAGKYKSPYWSPDGKTVVFTSDRSGESALWAVRVMDGRTLGAPVIIRPIADGAALGITRDGSYFYRVKETQEDVYIACIDPNTLKLITKPERLPEAPVGRNFAPRWSPDGKFMAYLHWEKDGAASFVLHSVIGRDERVLARIAVANSAFGYPSWFSDSQSVLIPDIVNRKLVFRQIQLENAQERIVFTPSARPAVSGYVNVGPDGRMLFYSDQQTEFLGELLRLMRRDLNTGEETELYKTYSTGSTMNIDVSPDGQRVAVLVNLNTQEGQRALVLVPADGGPAHELYRGPYSNPLPSTLFWSRDGKFVFVAAAAAGDSQEILAIPAAGGEPVHSGSLMLDLTAPSLSPDGRRIAFSGSSHEDQVWVIDKMIR